jgi:hypothetical protein
MLLELTIMVLSVGVLGLVAAFAIALGRVAGNADRQTERYAGRARAQATVSRESSTSMPPPRISRGTMRLPIRLNLLVPSRVDPGRTRS